MARTSRRISSRPIVLRAVEVIDAFDVSPHMRRVRLGGPQLGAFASNGFAMPPFESAGFDDHVKLVFPGPDGSLPHAGEQQEYTFDWERSVLVASRDYTVRSVAPDGLSFDVDFVRHPGGLAAEWAEAARPGDPIAFAGPKTCAAIDTDAAFHLLIGDETALPAMARWLEEAPPGARGQLIIEVPEAADRQELAELPGVAVTWLERGTAEAGHSPLLLGAVTALPALPESTFAWCAGEALTIAPIRRHLRNERGLAREHVQVDGYWRRPAPPRTASAAADADAQPAPAAAGAPAAARAPGAEDRTAVLFQAHEMTELLAPIVTRAAVTLGIGALVEAGHTTPTALAAAVGADEARLRPLVAAMLALGLLTGTPERFANTELGGIFAADGAADGLDLRDPVSRSAYALTDLVDVIGGAAPGRFALDPSEPAAQAPLEHAAEALLEYLADPLAAAQPLAGAGSIVLAGRGLGVLEAALAARPQPPQLMRAPGAGAWPQADCAVLVGALEGLPDAAALDLLRAARASASVLVLLDSTAHGAAADDHAAERALISLANTGRPLRERAELRELLSAAGYGSAEVLDVGWGFGSYDTVMRADA